MQRLFWTFSDMLVNIQPSLNLLISRATAIQCIVTFAPYVSTNIMSTKVLISCMMLVVTTLSFHYDEVGRAASLEAILEAGICDNILNTLGFDKLEKRVVKLLRFEKLFSELERARPHVPKDYTERAMVPCIFDTYRSCLISPDHLFLLICRELI